MLHESVDQISLQRLKPEERFTNNLGMEFVYIEPGTFMMGSPKSEEGREEDEILHEVTLTKGFYLQITEVTQRQWETVMGSNPSEFEDCGEKCPVEEVSWNDVQKFIQKLNERENKIKYRLPTEAEWEYAARAGTMTPFSFGDTLSADQANYDGAYPWGDSPKGIDRGRTTPVKSFAPNAWDLYDMHGNVWEWCQDWKSGYSSNRVVDPQGPSSGACRVLRGGSWRGIGEHCRSAYRNGDTPDYRFNNYGFRLAISLSSK